jgi:hypothetical protein
MGERTRVFLMNRTTMVRHHRWLYRWLFRITTHSILSSSITGVEERNPCHSTGNLCA